MENVASCDTFLSRIGFILATAGSAVEFGNLWRFPHLVEQYGSGIFLITYLIFAVTFGVILMMTELIIGRRTEKSCIDAFLDFWGRYKVVG